MSTKSVKEHRDYPDAEVSYDGPDPDYDVLDADPDRGDVVDADSDFPAPDVFPDTLFSDDPRARPKRGPGHGDS